MRDIGWGRSSFCTGGDCLEVGWVKSSFSDSANSCVYVKAEHGVIYVRDSKQTREDGQHDGPVQVWELDEWRGLLGTVKVGWRPDGVSEMVDGCVEFGLDRHDKHVFTESEWKAFVEGVIAEEFEPAALSSKYQSSSFSPAEVPLGSRPAAGRTVEPSDGGCDQIAATGAEVDRRDTAPVAALSDLVGADPHITGGLDPITYLDKLRSVSLDDELDHHLYSSAPAVAEERPVTDDRSEAGTGDSVPPALVPAAEPRVWMLPPDPGDEVTAVRDFEGDEWRRSGEFWTPSDESFKLYWHQLVLEFGPLTDATPAPLVPTDGAS